MENRRETAGYKAMAIVALVIAAFVYLLAGSNYGLNTYDEAIPLYGAERAMQGEAPYKDFFAIYPPGQFYFLGAVCSAFGWRLITERILSIFIALSISYFVFLFTRKISSYKQAMPVFVASVLLFGLLPLYARPTLTALLLLFAGALFLIQYLQKNKYSALIFAGAFAGLTGLFRHDFAVYMAAASSLVIFARPFIPGAGILSLPKKAGMGLSATGIFLIAALAPVIPAFLLLQSEVPFDTIKYYLFDYPLYEFAQYRELPFPNPLANILDYTSFKSAIAQLWRGMFFYTAPFACLVFIAAMIAGRKKHLPEFSGASLLCGLFTFLLTLFIFNQATVRSDFEHAAPSALVSFALMAFSLRPYEFDKGIKKVLAYGLLAFFAALPLGDKLRKISYVLRQNGYEKLDIERARGLILPEEFAENYVSAIKFIQSEVPPGGKIFVGYWRHDKLLMNDIMLYFLSKRGSATKYSELKPGVATELPVQKEIAGDIAANEANYIILDRSLQENEPNLSAVPGSRYLDEFIKANYSTVESYGNYNILKRNTKEFEFP